MDGSEKRYWNRIANFAVTYENHNDQMAGMGVGLADYIRTCCKDEGIACPSDEQIETIRQQGEQRIEAT